MHLNIYILTLVNCGKLAPPVIGKVFCMGHNFAVYLGMLRPRINAGPSSGLGQLLFLEWVEADPVALPATPLRVDAKF